MSKLKHNSIERYIELFVNRTDSWRRQEADGSYTHMKPYMLQYEPISAALVEKHMNGLITCSWAARDQNGFSKWCCWDSDCTSGDLFVIGRTLSQLQIPAYVEGRRPGRDGHLWVFLDSRIMANDLNRFDDWVRKMAGVATVDSGGIEFFPKKQLILTPYGSFVRGPLGIHRKPEAKGARGCFESANNNIQDQLQFVSDLKTASAAKVRAIVGRLRMIDRESELQAFRIVRKKRPRCSLDPAEVFADLIPRLNDNYYICNCPECGRDAWIYQSGMVLRCNHQNTCGYEISIFEYHNQKNAG